MPSRLEDRPCATGIGQDENDQGKGMSGFRKVRQVRETNGKSDSALVRAEMAVQNKRQVIVRSEFCMQGCQAGDIA